MDAVGTGQPMFSIGQSGDKSYLNGNSVAPSYPTVTDKGWRTTPTSLRTMV